MRRNHNSSNIMRKVLHFAILLEKEYIEQFVATPIKGIVKYVMGFDLRTEVRAQDCYQYQRVLIIVLTHESALVLVESQNSENC